MRARGFVGVLLVIASAAACGGKVIWSPPDGDGGAPATSTAISSAVDGVPATMSNGVDAASTGSVSMSLCEQFCAIPACAMDDECFDECDGLYTNGCHAEADAFMTCALAHIDSKCFTHPGDCDTEAEALYTCSYCKPGACSTDSNGACSCKGACDGTPVEVDCTPGKDLFTCQCVESGAVVGTCSDGAACSLGGCCAAFFSMIP